MRIEEMYLCLHRVLSIADVLALEILSPYQLTLSQCCLFLYIGKQHDNGTSVTELHKELHISKASLSESLKKMKSNGYLLITTSNVDERQKKIMITEKGKKALHPLTLTMNEINKMVFEKLTKGDLESMEKLGRNLQYAGKEAEQE